MSPYSPEKKRRKKVVGNEEGKKKAKDSDTVSKKSSRATKKAIKKYQFVKLKSAVAKIPVMNAVCPFTNDEILIAKKCMLNKWEKPPDFDKRKQKYEAELKKNAGGAEPHDSFLSGEKGEKEEKNSEESKKEPEEFSSKRLEGKDEEEEKHEGTVIDPKTRAPGGLWVEASDLPHCFQYFLVFYNPRSYTNKICIKDLWVKSNDSFVSNEDRLYMIIKPEEKNVEEENKQENLNEEFKDITPDIENEKTKVLVSFAPNGCKLRENEHATSYSFSILNVCFLGIINFFRTQLFQ